MNVDKLINGQIPIQIIDDEEKLAALAGWLSIVKEFSFDTEFDRFKRGYGFQLLLLQIFDGATCFIIDAVMIKDLKPLWPVFENESICKIVYSGREDVDLLKRKGCSPKNVFDVQVASALCNRSEKSFSKLLKSVFGIELDKSLQTSDWIKRPLDLAQIIYASNDVIHLILLKSMLEIEAEDRNVSGFIREENWLLELSTTKDFAPKLSSKQLRTFSEYHQEKLLELFMVRDRIARNLNMPPYQIVSDTQLEDILKDTTTFIGNPFVKGFSRKFLSKDHYKREFLEIVCRVDDTIDWNRPKERYVAATGPGFDKAKRDELLDLRYHPFKSEVISRYGENAAEFIIAGLSRKLSFPEIDFDEWKKYQIELYRQIIGLQEQLADNEHPLN
ncbi:MAG: ribonuclease D [Bacteroidetes bacterium]|nr:ribonuclease D [Bacteroidota bacterium]